jgi:hypothetical protein
MLSKKNKAEILIFSSQICPRVDGNKNFYRFSRNPIKFSIFELLFWNSCTELNEFYVSKKIWSKY